MCLKKYFTLLIFILTAHSSTGQKALGPSDNIDVSVTTDAVEIKDKCLLLADTNNNITPQNLSLQSGWAPLPAANFKNTVPAKFITKTLYLKFLLSNNGSVNDTVYFFPGVSYRGIQLFKNLPDGIVSAVKDKSQEDGFQPIVLIPGEQSTFTAALQCTKRPFININPQIIQRSYLVRFKRINYTKTYEQLVVGYMLSGLLLMMIVFNIANFRSARKMEFFYNGAYGICMLLLVFFSTYYERRTGVLASLFMGYLSFALLIAGTIFYIAFTRKFLEMKVNYPVLNKVFHYEEIVFAFLLCAYTIVYFFTNCFLAQILIENSMKIIALALGVVYIVIALKSKDPLANYLAVGSATLILFSTISLCLILMPPLQYNFFASPLFYYETGIVFELVFFLLGLIYKNRKELIEKIKEQEAMKLESEKQIFASKIAVLNAQQQERNRISADMHDDLGAGVTAIRLFSELAKSRLGNNTIPEIEKISSSANELLNNMNAIIWTMNNSNDSFGNMVAYIRGYALEYFENTGIKCSIQIDDNLPEFRVNGYVRRNVYLVVKEALNNILKHSKATEASLVLKKDINGGAFLCIQDNGCGIDFENIRRFGIGLKNMHKRMQSAGIDFKIENSNGTLITLHHSLKI